MVTKTVFSCQSCGYQSVKWLGRCPDCAAWNSFIEEAFVPASSQKKLTPNNIIFSSSPEKLSDIKPESDSHQQLVRNHHQRRETRAYSRLDE